MFNLTKIKSRYVCFKWKKKLSNQNGYNIVEHIMYMAPTWNYLT